MARKKVNSYSVDMDPHVEMPPECLVAVRTHGLDLAVFRGLHDLDPRGLLVHSRKRVL